MEVNRLNAEELVYELTIRGLPVGKVDDMRSHLRSSLKVEKGGKSVFISPYPFSFDKDMEALTKKIDEIKGLLDDFSGDSSSSDYRKILTKIEWALARVERVEAEEEEQKKQKTHSRAELIIALGTLQLKADGEDNEDDSYDNAEDLSMTAAVVTGTRSRVLVHKWDLKFSGEHAHSLNSFLERVNELAEARGINKTQLFRSALDLFTGKALIWYRANKGKFHKWSDLVFELKREFLPSDYDDRLIDEIKKRTQGKDESIGIYVAMMANMFSRLTDSLSEEQQLRILKRNISPFYQTQLGLTEISTIHDLVELGRRLESVRTSVEAFMPPPSKRNHQLLEPDLAYVATESPTLSMVHSSQNRANVQKCFKCGLTGHIARFCRRNFSCFGCGAPGVIRPRCPNCSHGRQNPEQSHSENGNGARN